LQRTEASADLPTDSSQHDKCQPGVKQKRINGRQSAGVARRVSQSAVLTEFKPASIARRLNGRKHTTILFFAAIFDCQLLDFFR
jgi:hypothetical protein